MMWRKVEMGETQHYVLDSSSFRLTIEYCSVSKCWVADSDIFYEPIELSESFEDSTTNALFEAVARASQIRQEAILLVSKYHELKKGT